MTLLNLGCGEKTSDKENVVNIDWSIYLRLKSLRFFRFFASFVLSRERLRKYDSLPDNILAWDLRKTLPFENDSIDYIYHSHVLEHLDRDVVGFFLQEIKRILKPNGIHRIVVPDFEILCKSYVSHIALCELDPAEMSNHDKYVCDILEQSVRKLAFGQRSQSGIIQTLERLFIGDARKRGETHQWMYDKHNLTSLLLDVGYKKVKDQTYITSDIPDWNSYALDLDMNGNEYKPKSLYLECSK